MSKHNQHNQISRSMAAAPLPNTDNTPDTTSAEAGGTVAEQIAPAGAAGSTVEDLLPFNLAGFRANVAAKAYDQKQGDVVVGTSRGLADMILKLKGTEGITWSVLGRVSYVVDKGKEKGAFRFSLPSTQKNGGAYVAATIQSEHPDKQNILDRWKAEVAGPAFQAWARGQESIKLALNPQTASQGGGLISLDLD
jgi:hypothetical protein